MSMPVVRQISWIAVIPQFIALATGISMGWVAHGLEGMLVGTLVYLSYSFGSRFVIARHHRHGIKLSRAGEYSKAIEAYKMSYVFFSRHVWLDRFRSLFLLSSSAMCYREMALINTAYCQFQLGEMEPARETYQRALDQFPNNQFSRMGLHAISQLDQAPDASSPTTPPA